MENRGSEFIILGRSGDVARFLSADPHENPGEENQGDDAGGSVEEAGPVFAVSFGGIHATARRKTIREIQEDQFGAAFGREWLGSVVGQSFVVGGSIHSIEERIDERGFLGRRGQTDQNQGDESREHGPGEWSGCHV